MRYLLFLSFLFISNFSFSQELTPKESNKLWGYEDKDGNLLIPYSFDWAEEFKGDFAIVKNNNQYGLIDKKGVKVVVCEFKYASSYVKGFFMFFKNNDFSKGIRIWISEKKILLPNEYEHCIQTKDGRILVAHKDGIDEIYSNGKITTYEYEKVQGWSSGLMAVSKNNKWGFIDQNFQEIVPIEFDTVSQFENKLVKIRKEGHWGMMNSKGEIVISLKYKNLLQSIYYHQDPHYGKNWFYYGKAFLVQGDNDKWGFVDPKNKILIPTEFDTLSFGMNHPSFGYLFFGKKNNKWGIIDFLGNEIYPNVFDHIEVRNKKIRFRKGEKFGFIATDGSTTFPATWKELLSKDRGTIHSDFYQERIIKINDRVGVFDQNYQPILDSIYHTIRRVNQSPKYVVKKNGKWGIISNRNKILIDFKYDKFYRSYRPDGFVVELNSFVGIIDSQENIIIPFEYENLYPFAAFSDDEFVGGFPTGFLMAKKNGKFGFINIKNETLIPFVYEDFRGLSYQLKYFRAKKDSLWGILNHKNEWVYEPQFDGFEFMDFDKLGSLDLLNYNNRIIRGAEIEPNLHHLCSISPHQIDLSSNMFAVKKDDESALINFSGKQLLPYGDYKFSRIYQHQNDTLILLQKDGKYGLIDNKGKVWIYFDYQRIQFYMWDIFLVKQKNKYGLLHKNGKFIQPIEYQEIKGQEVLINDKKGLLSKDRKSFLLPPIYDELKFGYEKGFEIIEAKKGSEWKFYKTFELMKSK